MICPYQLMSQLTYASWNPDTVTLADVRPFKYSPTYINTNRQRYTKHFLRLLFKLSRLQCFVYSQINPSSTQLRKHPSFRPSSLISFLSFFVLSLLVCFLNSSIQSFIHFSLPIYLSYSFLLSLFLSSFSLFFLLPFLPSSFISLILILITWRIWWAPNNASRWQMGFKSAFKGLIPSFFPSL